MPRRAQVFDQGLWAAAGGAVATSNVICGDSITAVSLGTGTARSSRVVLGFRRLPTSVALRPASPLCFPNIAVPCLCWRSAGWPG